MRGSRWGVSGTVYLGRNCFSRIWARGYQVRGTVVIMILGEDPEWGNIVCDWEEGNSEGRHMGIFEFHKLAISSEVCGVCSCRFVFFTKQKTKIRSCGFDGMTLSIRNHYVWYGSGMCLITQLIFLRKRSFRLNSSGVEYIAVRWNLWVSRVFY